MTQEWDKVRQNLADAGCLDSFVATYQVLENTEEKISSLRRYRRELLGKIHDEQKKLDCLDYLIYTLQKEGKTE